jgi:glycosyltransferase involved in cell wall biosynthesis
VRRPKIAVVATANSSGEIGGAERFFRGLVNALNHAGPEAHLLDIVVDESSFETIEESYLRFYDLDLSGYDGVISTKAPTFMVRHSNHICFLVHTIRVFYDMFEHEFPNAWAELVAQRDLIRKIDTGSLSYPRVKKIFCIGHEVRKRLLNYNGLDSEVLHLPLEFDRFYCNDRCDYIFMAGRLPRWKRVDLMIRAMKFIDAPLGLKIAGIGEDEQAYRELAENDERIEFLGRVSDERLAELYAGALAVAFMPRMEDYGYITIEAFRSGKPVLTCTDSGEPTYFVQNERTGFVCDPDPSEIAKKCIFLYSNPQLAREMGRNACKSIDNLTWPNVTNRLIRALGF